jgi:TPR repeat protein
MAPHHPILQGICQVSEDGHPRPGNSEMKMLIATIVLLIAHASPVWAGFDEGADAYQSGDYETALREWRPLAEQGDASAQFNLGAMYENGLGMSQDFVAAAHWYRKAAEQGLADAQFNLAKMFHKGQGVAQNNALAVRWYRKAAEQGEARAQYMLGFMYHNGHYVAQDDVEAVRWYRRAAAQGHVLAQRHLGFSYRFGWGVPQDYLIAHMWFNLAGQYEERDMVAVRLTPAQIEQAEKMARNWQPSQ